MKKTRRIAAMIAALAMAATMAVPFSMTASAIKLNTITITAGSGDDLTHSAMAAYQIFTGISNAADKLNVTGWGTGVTPATFYNALKADTTVAIEADATASPPVTQQTVGELFTALNISATDIAKDASAVAIANVISTFDDNSLAAEAVARAAWAANATASGTFTAATPADNSDPENPVPAAPAKIAGLADGYYAVFDTAKATKPSPSTEGAYTLGLLKVSKGETVDVVTKVSLPTFEKSILDVNDSSATLTKAATGVAAYDTTSATWDEDADHDIGDKVPFQLVATIPSNYDDYKAYWLKMHDNLQAGVFSLNDDDFVVYYVHGGAKTEIAASAYTKTTSGLSTDNNFAGFSEDKTEDFTIEFSNLKSNVPAIAAGDQIVVEYSATLTANANVGSAGNWNGAYLEYVNNPNWNGSDTPGTDDKDKTPEDTVVAFTYKTEFTKVDAVTGTPLSGAVFSLYKKYETAPTGGTQLSETDGSGVTDRAKYYRVGTAQTSAASTGEFGWTGLDDGEYVLVEDTAPTDPNGGTYTKNSPLTFTITGTHDNKLLVSLNGVNSTMTANDTHIDLNSGFVPLAGDTTKNATVTFTSGEIDASIANSKDTKLPSTGGMGTTLFILSGGVTAAAAGIYLVSKKRTKEEDAQ